MKFKLILVLFFLFLFLEGQAQRFVQQSSGTIATASKSSVGCSWADYNQDGFSDLFVTNSTAANQLFKNNGDGTFTEINSGAITTDAAASYAAIWGDYDNDGNLDLYVSNNPPRPTAPQANFLYKGNGAPNFDFTKIVAAPTQAANYTWSSSWVDYDNDGDLDLHVPDNKHQRRDFFYKNNGDGTFTATTPSFVTPNVESTGVVSWMDYDHDGDHDLFMIKSGRSHVSGREDNRIYHNMLKETGNLEFKRVVSAAMVKHRDLDFQASWGDYDNDGDMDVYLGNFDNKNYFYRNDGDSLFTKITTGPAVNDNTATLGSAWGDFDNDGDLDLYVLNTNGQRSKYYQNDGVGNFTSQNSAAIGQAVSNISAVQACASADFDNDGYLDLYVTNSFCTGCSNARNYLYKNSGGSNNFLQISLHGSTSNSSAMGSKVWVKATISGNPVWQLRHLTGNPTGNRSQDDLRLHFGLGDAAVLDSLIIEWPLGSKEIYTNIQSNQFLDYAESKSTGILDLEKEALTLEVYPNPSRKQVHITYQLKTLSQKIELAVVDNSQRVIATIFEGGQTKGSHQIRLDLSKWSAGVYYLVLKNETATVAKKMLIVK